LNPSISVIVLIGKTFPLAGAATLLSKPFQVSELAQVVRDTLDQE
jgi:hypothetical protein